MPLFKLFQYTVCFRFVGWFQMRGNYRGLYYPMAKHTIMSIYSIDGYYLWIKINCHLAPLLSNHILDTMMPMRIFFNLYVGYTVPCAIWNLYVRIYIRCILKYDKTLYFKGILWDTQWKPALYRDFTGILPRRCRFVYRNAFLLKKQSNVPRTIRALIASQSTFEK